MSVESPTGPAPEPDEAAAAARRTDRQIARDLLKRLNVDPATRHRFETMDRALDKVAFRDRATGEVFVSEPALVAALSPITPPRQSGQLHAALRQHLGGHMRGDGHAGAALSWDQFLAAAGSAPASRLFSDGIDRARTPDEVRAAIVAVVPRADIADVPARATAWLNEQLGAARTPAAGDALPTEPAAAALAAEGLNVNAINACVQRSFAAWFWPFLLFAVGCMIVTFPAWWLGLAFAGIVLGGSTLVILLNCIITAG